MAEHNSKTSLAKIVKFNKQNPDEYEMVGTLIKGETATLKKLHQLRADEPEKDKYGYYWSWVNKSAAMESEAKADGLELNRRKRKSKKV
jgi:hypothetical protein